MIDAKWKLALPVLPQSCCAHFTDKPLIWIVRGVYRMRGVYRSGGLAGTSCGFHLYTHASASQAQAESLAASENPWMRVTLVKAIGWSERP